MSRFQFPMNNILNIREKLEDKKKQEYGDAVMKLQLEKEKKQNLVREANFLSKSLSDKIKSDINPKEVILYNQYIQYLKKKTIEQNKVLDHAELYTEKKRQELLEAVKQKKMLESLKEKRWIEFIEESNREEQKQIDEIVSFQSQKRLLNGGKKNGANS